MRHIGGAKLLSEIAIIEVAECRRPGLTEMPPCTGTSVSPCAFISAARRNRNGTLHWRQVQAESKLTFQFNRNNRESRLLNDTQE
jgi:hypothetical protein